ncbi:MAG: D-alanyl-D-alanine carboxypeptidase/D-alanyl-D-alanine-endopeptidase [Usitatibacter sp.]
MATARADLPQPVREALAKAGIAEIAVSAVVLAVDAPQPAISHNARAAMNPASVMKVVTSYAALDLLGPAFTFRTDVLVAAEITGGVLAGDLYLRGGGDPKLTTERVWQLAHALRSRGLREIRGDIVIDRRYFAPLTHDPARFDGEARRAYNGGPDALLVNFNAIAFRFVPDGQGVRVVAEPDLPNVEIASRIQLTRGPCTSFRRDLSHDVIELGLIATITFSGSYPAACGERVLPLSLFDNARFAESNLRWLWSEVGGVLKGGVRAGAAPADARLFLRTESEPLASLVRDMNKHSNNVMARNLFLALSAERQAGGGDAASSARVVTQWLQSHMIDASDLVMENGSGLSRAERASAALIAAVLKSAWSSAVMPELMSSFPVLATDGTLKSRRVAVGAGQAHLKGGTLNDVQSLAGYVLDRGARRWIVVMIVNHPKAGAARPAIDALVEWTYESAAGKAKR